MDEELVDTKDPVCLTRLDQDTDDTDMNQIWISARHADSTVEYPGGDKFWIMKEEVSAVEFYRSLDQKIARNCEHGIAAMCTDMTNCLLIRKWIQKRGMNN